MDNEGDEAIRRIDAQMGDVVEQLKRLGRPNQRRLAAEYASKLFDVLPPEIARRDAFGRLDAPVALLEAQFARVPTSTGDDVIAAEVSRKDEALRSSVPRILRALRSLVDACGANGAAEIQLEQGASVLEASVRRLSET